MKAVLISNFGGADVLRIGEAPMQSTGPGQMLVQIIEALERRDAELAEKLVREQTDHLAEHVKQHLDWME